MLTRRSLLTGLGAIIAAPAIVRASSLMPVKAWVQNPIWGRSPAMEMLDAIRLYQGHISNFIAWEGMPLSAADIAALHAGADPMLFHPDKITHYYPGPFSSVPMSPPPGAPVTAFAWVRPEGHTQWHGVGGRIA